MVATRGVRPAGAAHVIGDDIKIRQQFGDERRPDLGIVGVAVHEDEGGELCVAMAAGVQTGAVAATNIAAL